MSELVLNDANVKAVLDYKTRDIAARDAWISEEPEDVYIIVPEQEQELKKFINDWLALCPLGSEAKVKEYEKDLNKKLKKQGYKLSEKQKLIITARQVAKIKRDYASMQSELMKSAHSYAKMNFIGYTYLAEIARILDTFLQESEKDNPKLIAICENKTPRRRV